jgi:hypothetical protein
MMNKPDSQPLTSMPEQVRRLFHTSITEFLKKIPPSDKDWSYQIKDDDLGLAYVLYYFHNPTDKDPEIGFMVIARVGCYDLQKKEMLPDENDKIIVFRFKTVDDLL